VGALFSALALRAATHARDSLEGLDFELSVETRIGGGRADHVLGTLPRDSPDGTVTVIEFKRVLGQGPAELETAMRKAFIQCDEKYSRLAPAVVGARQLRFLLVVVREKDGRFEDVSTVKLYVRPNDMAQLAARARRRLAEQGKSASPVVEYFKLPDDDDTRQ